MEVARWASKLQASGVVAFGMGGDELSLPTVNFRPAFDFARGEGLHLVCHAGEIGDAENVREAVELLGAERIGHGIAAVSDPSLMEHLKAHDIPLEICITSNLVTGVVKRLEDHPVRRLFEAGVPITLATDDPAMFACTLTDEYRLAAAKLGFSQAELEAIAENGFRYAFDPSAAGNQLVR